MPNPKKPLPDLLNDEVIQGLLLSDGYLSKSHYGIGNSRLEVGQTERRIDFLHHLTKYFLSIGLESSLRTYVGWNKQVQKSYSTVKLTTSKNPVFSELRKLWYPNGIKIVPKSLKLTPKNIAYEFMGDGYSRYGNAGLSVEVQLSTNSFTENDVRFLAKQLVDDYGISFHVWHKYHKY